jgi:hypothetical protein
MARGVEGPGPVQLRRVEPWEKCCAAWEAKEPRGLISLGGAEILGILDVAQRAAEAVGSGW